MALVRRGGDPRFEEFVRTVGDGLLRTAYLVTWDLGEAEDCVQEALAITARHWRRVERMASPGGYARTVTLRLALKEKARRSRRPGPLAEGAQVADARPQAALEAIDTRSELLALLARLPRNQRAVLALRYYVDLSEVEIADQLGWPVGTVKSTAARALDRLRREIGADEPSAPAPLESPLSPSSDPPTKENP